MKKFLLFLLICVIIPDIKAQVATVPTVPPTTTTTIPTTIPTAPTAPITSTVTTTILVTTTNPPIDCPLTGIHHLPAENCQEFILCIYGRPHGGICPEETLFDPLTSSCLSANLVDCGTRYRP